MTSNNDQRTPVQRLVAGAIASSRTADLMMTAALERTFQPRALKGKTPEELKESTSEILSTVTPQQMTHNVLRRVERNRLSVSRSISFRTKINEMSEARHLGVLRPTWQLDPKPNAYRLVDSLGVRRPVSDRKTYTWAEVPKETPSVIKAVRATGSRGCYLLYSSDKIVHVRDGEVLESQSALAEHARRLMQADANPLPDRWMSEELILEDRKKLLPARDLKFYTFYGEIVLVLEATRHDGVKMCYWDGDGKSIDVGRYHDRFFHGAGFEPGDSKVVSLLSKAVPHPFMRIDMLKSDSGLVFGEFTPRPGDFEQFDDEWDRILGEAWVRAESRILEDLLRGKSFDDYLEATRLLSGWERAKEPARKLRSALLPRRTS